MKNIFFLLTNLFFIGCSTNSSEFIINGSIDLKDGDMVSIKNSDDKAPQMPLPETKPLPSDTTPINSQPQTNTKQKQATKAVEVHDEAA